MKFKARIDYEEYTDGQKTDTFKALAEVLEGKDRIDFFIKRPAKNNIQLSVLKNNDIILLKATGMINYEIVHEINRKSFFEVELNNNSFISKFPNNIYTRDLKFKEQGNEKSIYIEFEREESIIKVYYKIKI